MPSDAGYKKRQGQGKRWQGYYFPGFCFWEPSVSQVTVLFGLWDRRVSGLGPAFGWSENTRRKECRCPIKTGVL